MRKNIQTEASGRVERVLDRLADGLSNDVEIETLRNLLWAAFETIPSDNYPQFLSKISAIERSAHRTLNN